MRPNVSPGPTVVDVEPTGVGGPSADAEPTGVAGPSTESPMEPPASEAGPSVAAKQTCVSGPTSVDGSTRLETDNVEVGEEDINEGRANDDDEDLSYRAESESDSEDLRGEVWVTDDEDEELTQIFEKARRFNERRAAGTVGDEDLRQNEDPTRTFHGTEEREEGNAQDTDYLASDDVGSYETDSDGEVVCKKTNRFDYKYTKNEKDRIRAKCKGVGCPFMIYLGKGADGIYQIKIMPKLRLIDMMALGKEEIKVELTKNVCSRARKWAVNQIRGSVKKEFNRLYDYVFALREADPTGTFDLVVERPTPNDTPIFRRATER
ncbi:hypothetical protein V6N11_075145 [Hibiscus sabdariffa]|uniref:Transposase MuDR plant domain-containing protein n=1 Tax=Hibiscus sabdariffa TaxID=183260 RepID=A0ABR2R627_9ROSI